MGDDAQRRNRDKDFIYPSFPTDATVNDDTLDDNDSITGAPTGRTSLSAEASVTSLIRYNSAAELLNSSEHAVETVSKARGDYPGRLVSVHGKPRTQRRHHHPITLKLPFSSSRKSPDTKSTTIISPIQSTPSKGNDMESTPAQPKPAPSSPPKGAASKPPTKPKEKGSVQIFLVSEVPLSLGREVC